MMDHYNWIEDINAHRKANNLTPITVAEAEDQLCHTIDPEWCVQEKDDVTRPVSTRLTLNDVIAGATSYIKVLFGLQSFVSQSEADRRAKTCANCFLNVNVQGCGACARLATIITGDVANQKTKYDSSLKACGVCSCPLQAIVHFPISALENADKSDEQLKYPLFCWRKIGGTNYES